MLDAVYDFLVGEATITAIVGDDIYPAHFPQSGTYPALIFSLVSATHEHTLDGGAGVVNARFQFDCFADDPETAASLQDALRLVLQGYTGTMGDRVVHGKVTIIQDVDLSESGDEGSDDWVYRRVSDYLIRFEEPTT